MKRLYQVKGKDRQLSGVLCVYCGSDHRLYYCALSDQFICNECLKHELDEQKEENNEDL
jgi:hypothetical protein